MSRMLVMEYHTDPEKHDPNEIVSIKLGVLMALQDRIGKLETALKVLRSDHHYDCEDCFYSCPESGNCCDERLAGSECTCGTDQRNAIIDNALKGGEQ